MTTRLACNDLMTVLVREPREVELAELRAERDRLRELSRAERVRKLLEPDARPMSRAELVEALTVATRGAQS